MRWPWMSRLLYDRLTADLDYERYRATMNFAHHETVQDQYANLLEKYHTLKLAGASIPESVPILQRPEFDPVQAAITAKAGPDKRLRAMMSREAMQSRTAGIPDIEIIQAIEHGVTVDEEGVA